MAREIQNITRSDLRRRMVVNALTKPLNVAVGAGIVVAALALGATWLIAVAALAYAVLAVLTFFDEDEAKRVGDRAYGRQRGALARGKRLDTDKLAPPIAAQVATAHDDEKRIAEAIAGSELPFTEVGAEVDSLVREMDETAIRAQAIYSYLATQDPARLERRLSELRGGGQADLADARERTIAALEDQISAQQELQDQLDRYLAEMEHLTASLGAVNAQLVRMSVASDAAGQTEVAVQVRELRDQVKTLAQGMQEAYSQAGPAAGEPPASAPSG